MSTIPLDGDPGLLVTHCASEIEPERIEWLWPARTAKGKHTCIAGEPGTGKSQLATYIAAQISMGATWPCGEGRAPQGSVLVLSAEDGEADTIVPRLYAAEADLGRVHIVSAVRTSYAASRGFNLQADIELLEQKIAELGDVALITIDPISSYLGKTDSHKNAEVRGVIEPLSAMAERTRVAVLSVTHFSKTGAANTTKALHRFIGSIAFVGAPRMAFAVIDDAEDKDRRLFLHAKNNLAAPPQGLAFRLHQTIVGEIRKGIVASCVDWEGEPVTITANEALAAEAGSTAAKPSEDQKHSCGSFWQMVRRWQSKSRRTPMTQGCHGRQSVAQRRVWALS
jgi:putative DNA primase/helicase